MTTKQAGGSNGGAAPDADGLFRDFNAAYVPTRRHRPVMEDDVRVMWPPEEDPLEPLRRRWLDLIRRELPEAAASRPDWPVRLDHCFARVILDHVHGRPWREATPAPAYKTMSPDTLRAAVAAAEAVLSGDADLAELDARSLRMRGKRPKRPQAS